MSRRTWYSDKRVTSQGLVEIDFSFTTAGASTDPSTSAFRGCGGLTGTDSASGVSNTGPSAIASITWTATGTYLVTFADGYRYVTAKHVSIDDAADTLVPRVGTVSNEGSGATTAVTAQIVVRAMATGTATESTGRRISGTFVMKDSGNGT